MPGFWNGGRHANIFGLKSYGQAKMVVIAHSCSFFDHTAYPTTPKKSFNKLCKSHELSPNQNRGHTPHGYAKSLQWSLTVSRILCPRHLFWSADRWCVTWTRDSERTPVKNRESASRFRPILLRCPRILRRNPNLTGGHFGYVSGGRVTDVFHTRRRLSPRAWSLFYCNDRRICIERRRRSRLQRMPKT